MTRTAKRRSKRGAKPRPRSKTRRRSSPRSRLARIQAIVKRLSVNFRRTAIKSVAEMRRLVAADWPHRSNRLFHLSHDLKGQGTTFGLPAVTAIATLLCRDIEAHADIKVISAHVEALAASLR